MSGISEGYLRAAVSSDLRLDALLQKDVDRLIAAAYAAGRSDWGDLAIRVFRLRTGDMTGTRRLSEDLGDCLLEHLRRESMTRHSGAPKVARLSRVVAADIAMAMLKWMQSPVCRTCEGRRHPTIPDTPKLDVTRRCRACAGTGLRPLETGIRQEHAEHIRWLTARIERAHTQVFGDMGRILGRRD